MTIEIPVPDVSQLNPLAWVGMGITGWYLAAAVVLRVWYRVAPAHFGPHDPAGDLAGWWVTSPVIVPIVCVWSVVQTVGAVLSLGILPFPWQKWMGPPGP